MLVDTCITSLPSSPGLFGCAKHRLCSAGGTVFASDTTDGYPFMVHPMPQPGDGMETLYQHQYNEVISDLTNGSQLELTNGLYAQGTHSSQEIIGWSWKDSKNVYTDTMMVLGTYEGVTMVKTPIGRDAPDFVSMGADGHQFGIGKCHWIRHCYAWEKVGQKCSASIHTVTFEGYCFESSTGTIECGALTQKRDKWGQIESEMFIDAPSAGKKSLLSHACPYKAPVVTNGEHEVNRMLIAGCMKNGDASYNKYAEVHVPQMCSTPVDMVKGCLFPRATNYDMAAVQSDTCYYNVRGCTNSLAVNYNIEAYEDDGSCIVAVKGCTIKPQYTGVALDTPEYDSSFVGVPLRLSDNTVATPTATFPNNANNYNALANVLEGCILTVEGCMDSTALNYDSFANANTNTWCIPIVSGCMMPTIKNSDDRFQAEINSLPHRRDGLAVNYEPLATVDAGCVVEREGCTDSTGYNYDPRATKAGQCWPDVYGCLHPGALNFGCPNEYAVGAPTYEPQLTPCTDSNGKIVAASKHQLVICNFAPPPPAPPSSGEGQPTVAILVKAAEDAQTVIATGKDVEIKNKLQADVANAMGSQVSTTAGSSLIDVKIQVPTTADMTAGVAALQAKLGSREAASAYLGVTVLATPSIVGYIDGAADADNVAVIVGATVGGFFGLLLLGGVAYTMMKRKQSKVEA